MLKKVFEYDDYRQYMSDFYNYKKSVRRYYSFSNFAKKAGITSENYVSMIISGVRNLTVTNIIAFASAMELDERETEYFEALVHFCQSKSDTEKDYFANRLKSIRTRNFPFTDY